VDRKSGVDPSLRATLDQDTIVASGKLELLNGFGCPSARLTKDKDGCPRLVLRDKGIEVKSTLRPVHGHWHILEVCGHRATHGCRCSRAVPRVRRDKLYWT